MLREAGMLTNKQGQNVILKPILDPTAETWLKAQDMEYYLNAVEGVR